MTATDNRLASFLPKTIGLRLRQLLHEGTCSTGNHADEKRQLVARSFFIAFNHHASAAGDPGTIDTHFSLLSAAEVVIRFTEMCSSLEIMGIHSVAIALGTAEPGVAGEARTADRRGIEG